MTSREPFKDRLTFIVRLTVRRQDAAKGSEMIVGMLKCLETGRSVEFLGFDSLRDAVGDEICLLHQRNEDQCR